MASILVKNLFGGDPGAAGTYTLVGGVWTKGIYEFINDSGGAGNTEWELTDTSGSGTTLETSGLGDLDSPASASWVKYSVTEISSPSKLPIGDGSSSSVSSPGTLNPVSPGVPDKPENYVGTFEQTLTSPQKAQAKTNLDLGNVNNTSDANKPISDAAQEALDLKADLPPANFHFEGDSITAGTGGQTETPWRTSLQSMSAFAGRGTFTSSAVSGSSLASMTARYVASVRAVKPEVGETKWLLGMIGINDAASAALTSANYATWFADLEAYWALAKADGFKICWLTPTPRNLAEFAIHKVSELMLKSSTPDIVVDTNQVILGPSAGGTPAYYMEDGVHLTVAGGVAMAKEVNKMMATESKSQPRGLREWSSGLYHQDKIWMNGGSGQMSLGSHATTGSAISLFSNARISGSLTTHEQKLDFHLGLAPSSGSMATGSISGEFVAAAPSGKGLALALWKDGTGTQTVRWRLAANGVWVMSKVGAESSYGQQDAAQFGLASASGSHMTGSITNDLVIVAPAGQKILFGTSTIGNTQQKQVEINSLGHVLIHNLDTFADNTAAASLATNTLYKTATGELRIKV